MATRAERFRAMMERTGDKHEPPAETEQEEHHEHPVTRIAASATFAQEENVGPRPSRKSTRKSANRAKPDGNLERRQTRAMTSPKARAERATAQR